jgi:ABC-2 type transport system ATP-binding protein
MLKVSHINKSYGDTQVLFDIDFEMKTGEVVGFLGPNGAGKSTLMKMITGSLSIDSGEIEVCGEKVTTENCLTKSNIGYLPELNPLYPDMYVREYLDFTASFYGLKRSVRKKAVEEVISKTGLTSEAHKRLRQLSKG